MKKNLFPIDFAEKTITATKTTLKKASNPNTPEYKELATLMEKHRDFRIVTKEIKKSSAEHHPGVTKEFIEAFISIKENAALLKKQYEKVCKDYKFPMVRKWFLETFPNFDMEAAKKEIEAAALAKIKSVNDEPQAQDNMTEASES